MKILQKDKTGSITFYAIEAIDNNKKITGTLIEAYNTNIRHSDFTLENLTPQLTKEEKEKLIKQLNLCSQMTLDN